jgi:outer membrane receptor protein involved in Fe transport
MKFVCQLGVAAALVLASAPAGAQQATAAAGQAATSQPAAQDPQQNPDEPQKYEETVVVSASKTEEKLVNAPATMTVIGAQTIQSAPSQNFAELLRAVPGMNLTQVSARDINVTSRGATSTLATGQLALLDGRSLYQDFFGFVMWDFLPVNLNEIKQVEVIHGPASAVWGANAVNGVVNVITKAPREMQGTSFTLGVGGFDRTTDACDGDPLCSKQGAGTLFYVSGTHAQAVNDRWAFKLSGGAYTQDPLARPRGTIPCEDPDVCFGTKNQFPAFVNQGTTQPKFDGRVDYDYPDGKRLSFSGGVAGTEGIMHSGIGPFDINSGSVMSYGKANFTKQAFRVGFFTNILDGDATNLLTVDPRGNRIPFAFKTKTFDVEASNVQTFAQKHVVTYGGNLRYNTFDLSIAPLSDNRTEGGAFAQDEIFLSNRVRLVAGARVDRFDYLNDVVFSPRVTLLVKPHEDHTVRLSYNRAYRSPSVINNFLDVTIAEPINLGAFSPQLAGRVYLLPVRSAGNEVLNANLDETSVDAYELGYTGIVADGRAILSAAFYVNRTTNDILFTEDQTARWTATNPPPGWPLPAGVINLVPGRSFPGLFTYRNLGRSTQKGIELGVQSPVQRYLNVFANYSYQATPTVNFPNIVNPLSEINLPAKNRFNVGFNYSRSRWLGDMSVTYSDSAYWQDVLDDRYHGTTDAYTLVSGGVGMKWAANRLTTSVKVINLFNQEIQQHVFGDILKRQVMGELRVNF